MKPSATILLAIAAFLAALLAGLYLFVDGSHVVANTVAAPRATMRPGKWHTTTEITTRAGNQVGVMPKETGDTCYTADQANAYISLASVKMTDGFKLDYLKPEDSGAQLRATRPDGVFLVSSTTTGETYTVKVHLETTSGTTSGKTDIVYTGVWAGECSG